MMSNPSILIKLLVVQCLAVLCVAKDFDFFYFVQQSCTVVEPEFQGLQLHCPGLLVQFKTNQISDLASRLEKDWPTLACPSGDGLKFWGHEWNKHGTCAESVFDQHSYFQTALDLKNKANLLQALTTADIRPNGKFYHLESIKEAIRETVGVTPYIECNVDTSGNHQLYQVYMCVDSSGSNFIKCPVLPHSHPCGSKIEFPSFSDNSNSKNDEL
ncbi:intracellular ribonuclease LX-like [Camellia sinensis]|uniref:Uncharacterized protein n=1 Tax=Camellia sinensis var. sinensis TaxID=542762 RepID=A0A4S4F1F2_CAMSN|nr:intracellular ribonuclease LX-like [Camellia sinensis]THG23270.1 hypothetical protein TEA_020235 [Camellia sinensis var. sinensis]